MINVGNQLHVLGTPREIMISPKANFQENLLWPFSKGSPVACCVVASPSDVDAFEGRAAHRAAVMRHVRRKKRRALVPEL